MKNNIFNKSFIFITGAPRSGTSLITKIINSHPEIALIMENIFDNRRRHWSKADYWLDDKNLKLKVYDFYKKFKEPIIGNKVCTPDVWSAEDINRFCSLFSNFKIIFIVRDPGDVSMSRFNRENYIKEFNLHAKKNILLNFDSQFDTYISSWRQSIENYWKLKDLLNEKIKLVYYEDFCNKFENEIIKIFKFLDIEFSDNIFEWYKYPSYNAKGNLVKDLKYKDEKIFIKTENKADYPKELINLINQKISLQFKLWESREI